MVYSYTDLHDVDEDETTIVRQGGRWDSDSSTGIALRNMFNSSTSSGEIVASMKKKINRTYTPFGDAYYANVVVDLH